jgi:hypothetical protein
VAAAAAAACWLSSEVVHQSRGHRKNADQADAEGSAEVYCSVLADIAAPYVYACWQIRWKVRNEEVRSDEREADGSDAMV